MTKKQRFDSVIRAMQYNPERKIYIFSDDINEDVKNILMSFIIDDNIGGNFDLSYEICCRACDLFSDIDLDDLSENDDIFYDNGMSSLYTDVQLSYLNSLNHKEILDIVKQYESDIPNACVIWFDDMVRSVALQLKDYILQTND